MDSVINTDDKNISSLLRLPLEVRNRIYECTLKSSRRPPAAYVHQKLLSNHWKDKPSPLLSVNKQVRAEMFDLLRQSPFTMRITWQDSRFDALALSSFIVQQRRRGFDDIPHLVVEIWPPHPDRPIDTYWIYEHLRLLREDLRAISRVPKLDLVFLENDIATWVTGDGKLPDWLGIDDPLSLEGPMFTDIGHMLDLFERLTNVGTAWICLPGSFTGDAQYQELHDYARETEGIMMGTIIPEHDDESEEINAILEKHRKENNQPQDYIDCAELCLKRATARIARKKLATITKTRMMNESDYYKFIEIWPHFETLDKYEEEGEFDMKNYVMPIDYDWQ